MNTYEIWEGEDSFVLVEQDHLNKEELTRGCNHVATFDAVDWDEANAMARVYRLLGDKALEQALAS